MLTPNTRLQPNEEEVASRIIDGEAIMINLSNGNYYSMDSTGAVIWEGIMAIRTLLDISYMLIQRYEVPLAQAQADAMRLGAELLQEQLVLIAGEDAGPPALLSDSLAGKLPANQLGIYDPPTLNIYRDMSDLLALDPPMPSLKDIPWKNQ